MKIIKFRAWHPDESKMYYFDSFEEMGEWSCNDEYRAINSEHASVKWLQYTGLKDKNGKEIYDGDIVTYNNEKCVIEFYANQWCIDMSVFYPQCREGWCKKIPNDININSKIIGNIYENPELLEK